MTITVLPTPNFSRRYCVTQLDSLNRLLAYEAVYLNSTHDYDLTHGTTLERYDPATMSWTTLAEVPPTVQSFGSCIDSTDHLYRVGGQGLSGVAADRRVDIYNSGTNTWSSSVNLPAATAPPPAAWIDHLGVLRVGASTGLTTGFLWEFSGGSWVTRATAPFPGSLQGVSAFVDSANKAYFFGNENAPSRMATAVMIYDPAANTWASTTAPFALNYATVYLDVANGIFYGVRVANTAVTPCKYTIATNTWATLTALTYPTISFATLGGWIYDPATNACYCLGVISAAVGGTSNLNILKYDVATDTWSATTDFLSAARFLGDPAKISFDGTGYYIPQGPINTAGGQDAVNVFEYFVPGGAPAPRRRRAWAAVIG